MASELHADLREALGYLDTDSQTLEVTGASGGASETVGFTETDGFEPGPATARVAGPVIPRIARV